MKQKLINLEELKSKIENYSHYYYNLNQTLISDADYDKLVLEYKKLLNEIIDNISDNELELIKKKYELDIGAYPNSALSKVKHIHKMYSLDNAFDYQSLEGFIKKIKNFLNLKSSDQEYKLKFNVEPKIDGLSFSAKYTNGYLDYVATRGNGLIGEDVTRNMLTIKNFPKKIDMSLIKETLNIKYESSEHSNLIIEIRGEVFITKSDFEALNLQQKANGLEAFANPRNAAAGSLRQLDYKITKLRPLKYISYEIVSNLNISTQVQSLNFLNTLGFNTFENKSEAEVNLFDLESLKEIQTIYQDFLENRKNLDYEVDGMVIKVNDLELQKRLGYTNHAPRYAIAYKFPAIEAMTRLIDIDHQIGRTGTITPVAILDPVQISGALITKATLHNFSDIKKKNIMLGDMVFLVRSGDVIPKIIGPNLAYRDEKCVSINMIAACPGCQSDLEFDDPVLKCINFYCPEILIQRLYHFVSSLEIDDLGIKNIRSLYEAGFIDSLPKIFDLENHKLELVNLKRMGLKIVSNILENIKKSKKTNLSKFIFSLGIPDVGKNISKILALEFISIENLLDRIEKDNLGNIQANGIGPNISHSIETFFLKYKQEIFTLTEKMDIMPDEINIGKLHGLKFIFTGTLSISRKEAKALIEKNGGIIKSSISDDVILVKGEGGGSKLLEATKRQAKIMSEEELFSIINN